MPAQRFVLVLVFVAVFTLKVVAAVDYRICQETAIRRKWALKVCLRMFWSNWSVQSARGTCYHPSRYVATDTTRNKALERLYLRVECPCPNTRKPPVCTFTFPIALIRDHEDVCQFGPFDCPLNYRVKSNWIGPLTEIKGHVLHKHKDLLRHPYVRKLGLTKPAVGKFNKDKIHDDFYFQMIIYFLKRMRL